ncbi:MAG: potassium channel protein [Acidobacteria bacterium]|nr:potassium channel protein [Acidobacteriota bacterium]
MTLRKRFIFSLAAVLAILIIGMIGYHFIEGWNWFDGLYMTVITLATIGYGETHPLTHMGRAFTLFLIVVGVAVFGFLISSLTQAIIETEIASVLGRRKVFKDINQLNNHYILCGAGRVGMRIVDELEKKEVDFVIIEHDPVVAEKLLNRGMLVLMGDATDEQVLEGAQIRTARALITAASGDAENVYIVLTARGLNPNIFIVARANDLPAERQLKRAGANKVVSPVLIGSHRMAQAALSPAVADFIELTTMTESLDLNFDQIRIGEGSPLDGIELKDSGIRSEHHIIIVAIIPSNEEMIFNPEPDRILKAGDLLIAIGTSAGLTKLAKTASYKRGHTMRLKNPLKS